MERIAVISDIHGNIPALRAVLADIRQRDVQDVICLGDLVGKGPHPQVAIEMCQEVCGTIIQGNWDDSILSETAHPVLLWQQQRLTHDHRAFLATLPLTSELTMSGKRLRLFHASQQGVHHRVYLRDAPEIHQAMFTNTAFTGQTALPDVVGYGDIHSAYVLGIHQKTLFNVGSVGNPLDGTQASYVLVEGVYNSPTPAAFSLQIVRVPYDIHRAIQDAQNEQMPDIEPYIQELTTARYRFASS